MDVNLNFNYKLSVDGGSLQTETFIHHFIGFTGIASAVIYGKGGPQIAVVSLLGALHFRLSFSSMKFLLFSSTIDSLSWLISYKIMMFISGMQLGFSLHFY